MNKAYYYFITNNYLKKILYAIDFIEKQELDVCFMQEVTNRFCI